jgi:ABC-type transport system involved in multi-copper enzyme maturation permease subunit
MTNLIKTDLKRIFKDKLFLITCIIAAALALFSPLLNVVVFAALDATESLEMLGMLPTAKSFFFQSFLPGNNIGLIMPILVAIILCKDFSQGTVRNKIICGHSRFSIFLSMFISSSVVSSIIMIGQGLITLFFSLAFFEYSSEAFSLSEFGYVLISILFEILVYVLISAIISFFCVAMKNAGTAVVMYVAVSFLFAIVGSVTLVAVMFTEEGTLGYKVLEFLNNANVFTSTLIGGGESYTAKEIFYILTPSVGGSALFVLFGSLIFKKKDLK